MLPYNTEPPRLQHTRYTSRVQPNLALVEHSAPVALAPLPDWMLAPGAHPSDLPTLKRANELTTFEATFARVLEIVSTGQPLRAALGDDPRNLDYSRFLRWVMQNEARKERYYDALAIGAEVVSQHMLEIADAADTVEDVQRSTLRINTRKHLLGIWNRKRFGEVKQIDQNVTIDMVGAMEAARERASRRDEIIDVKPKELP